MKPPFIIRRANPADAAIIADFNTAMARETENRTLPDAVIRAGVERMMGMPDHGFYLVAESGDRVVGCLMITTEWSDWRNGFFWWIQSVYIAPDFRRRGVYRAMYRHVMKMAADHPDVCGFRLYVEKDNGIARKTYSALGMRETPYRLYETIRS